MELGLENEQAMDNPEDLPSQTAVQPPIVDEPIVATITSIGERVSQAWSTLTNVFGLKREYQKKPTRVPTSDVFPIAQELPSVTEIISPYPNLSSFRYAHLFSSIAHHSKTLENKVLELFLRPDFLKTELTGVNFDALKERVLAGSVPWGDSDQGWRNGTVKINVPLSGRNNVGLGESERTEGVAFQTDKFWHRPIVPVLKSILTSNEAQGFHYEPFKQTWSRPESTDTPVRVYDELFTGDAWLEEHERVQQLELPPDEPDIYPRAIAGIMLWSDSTHVAQFGQQSVWPIYMTLGNQSKYERASSGSHALHHMGYLPSVSILID